MPSQSIVPSPVLPVFILEKWVKDGTTVYDICSATEKVSGPGTVDGATCISGLWRIYPLTDVARVTILTKGISLGNKTILPENANPFSYRKDGVECQGTRLTISNLPFSYSNEAVAKNLLNAGLKLRSQIMFEKARGPDGLLTDWRNGRRFVWIDLPSVQVKKNMKMGSFSASLYYREMKNTIQCRRCLREGHKAIDCPNEEVCLSCKLPGHRKGDRVCSHSGVRSVTFNNHDDNSEYTDLWFGGVTNGESPSETVAYQDTLEKVVEDVHLEDNLNLEGDRQRDKVDQSTSNESTSEEIIEDPSHNKRSVVSNVNTQDLEDKESGSGKLEEDEPVTEDEEPVTRIGDSKVVKEKANARQEEANKVSEREDGAVLEGKDVSPKESYKEKLMASPSKVIPRKGKNKGVKAGKAGPELSETPKTQKRMVQSILNFVGKRSSDTLSPEGTESCKPNSKRPANS